MMVSIGDLLLIATGWISERRRIATFDVYVAGNPQEADEMVARATESLRLIERHDAALRAQMAQDVRRFYFTLLEKGIAGECRTGIAAIAISPDYARRASVLRLAMLLVHEATHARLYNEGNRYNRNEHQRIEHLCVDAEIAFAQLVPGSDEAIQRARKLLETEWWDTERHAASTIAELTHHGVPAWFAQWLVARYNRRGG